MRYGVHAWSRSCCPSGFGATIDTPIHEITSSSLLATFSNQCGNLLRFAAQRRAGCGGSVRCPKAAGDGVPAGSAIFLDVEFVTNVSSALVDYMSGWIAGLLADSRFKPAIYCAKSNAAAVYAAATAAYAAAGRHDAPPFWIASSTGFAITSVPTNVGLTYATVWQGLFDVSLSWVA